ncbi:MAG: hypothetical protein ACFFB3_15600 [Candidatus Hodarchaeota archaeon]
MTMDEKNQGSGTQRIDDSFELSKGLQAKLRFFIAPSYSSEDEGAPEKLPLWSQRLEEAKKRSREGRVWPIGLSTLKMILTNPILSLFFLLIAGLLLFTIAQSLLHTVIVINDDRWQSLQPGAEDAGFFLLLFFLGTYLLYLTLALLILSFFYAKGSKKSEDQNYLIKLASTIEKTESETILNDYFYSHKDEKESSLMREKLKHHRLAWSPRLKKARFYWNPLKILEYFYGETWKHTLFLFIAFWLFLASITLYISMDIVLGALENRDDLYKWAKRLNYPSRDLVKLLTGVMFGFSIVLCIWPWRFFRTYRELISEFKVNFDVHLNSLLAELYRGKTSPEQLARLETIQNIRKDLDELPGHPFGMSIHIGYLSPVLAALLTLIAQIFL